MLKGLTTIPISPQSSYRGYLYGTGYVAFLFYYPFVFVLPLSFIFSYFTPLTTLPARRQFAGSSAPNQTKSSTSATAFFFFPFTFLTWRFFVRYTCVSYMCFRHREYEGRRRGRGRRKLNPSTLRCGFVVEFSIRLT